MRELMIVDAKTYKKFFEGYFVRDATIGFASTRLGFLLVEETDPEDESGEHWKSKLVAVNLEQPMESRIFSLVGTSLDHARLSSAWEPNQTEYVATDVGRRVWSYKPKVYKGDEARIPFDGRGYGYQDLGEVGCAIRKTLRVGHTVFAVGDPVRIFERKSGQQWQENKDIPMPADLKVGRSDDEIRAALSRNALRDLAGLNEHDMYAVGDAGLVWRRVDKAWRQTAIPTNVDLFTVAVSPDGMVHITDRRGSVWRGRDDQWERIVQADHALPYQDSAWFAGHLWCTNDSAGPFVLEGKKMVPAHRAKQQTMPAQVARFAHRIDVSPDGKVMLVAGLNGAATYDGKTWTVLFDGEPDT